MPDERDEDEATDDSDEQVDEDSEEEESEEESESHWYDEPAPEHAPEPPDPCELVTIATFGSPPEAETARLVLDDAGIPVFLAGLETDSVLRIWNIAEVKLQVRQSDAEAAAAILAEKQAAMPDDSPTETEDSDRTSCLSCGQPIPDEATACPACGWSYADDQETQFRADT